MSGETFPCAGPGCTNRFERIPGRKRRKFCSGACQSRYWRTNTCYCYAPLVDGKCPYGCPPEANPAWLAEQDRRIAAREAHARREERFAITDAEMRRMRRAMRALDPVTRHVSKRSTRAAYRSHAAGARR